MITHSETIVITHNDPNYDFYKNILTEENGWLIKSDTFATSYTKTMWYRIEEQEKQNESNISD